MGWCDDSKSRDYNKLVKLPFNYNHEKLYKREFGADPSTRQLISEYK